MIKAEWYFEYELQKNRPGLLGDISSLLGMLSINIMTINGVENNRRGLLLLCKNEQQIMRLSAILTMVDDIKVTKLRRATLRDKLAVRHGRYIHRDIIDHKTVKFVRDELGLLVDYLAELCKTDDHLLIGVRGMPRVGKTESIVAASVCANKRWVFVSSTLLKQTVRQELIADEYSSESIFIIDGIVSKQRASDKHWELIREIMRQQAVKIVEHPDIFIRETEYSIDDFDHIIELRRTKDEKITYETYEQTLLTDSENYSMYDF
ncbi:MAG TPA: DUF3388 domain-containing protein [Bacillota bacterium]|nr:DUF3388 domain-containing protein [Bacillota bacterium]